MESTVNEFATLRAALGFLRSLSASASEQCPEVVTSWSLLPRFSLLVRSWFDTSIRNLPWRLLLEQCMMEASVFVRRRNGTPSAMPAQLRRPWIVWSILQPPEPRIPLCLCLVTERIRKWSVRLKCLRWQIGARPFVVFLPSECLVRRCDSCAWSAAIYLKRVAEHGASRGSRFEDFALYLKAYKLPAESPEQYFPGTSERRERKPTKWDVSDLILIWTCGGTADRSPWGCGFCGFGCCWFGCFVFFFCCLMSVKAVSPGRVARSYDHFLRAAIAETGKHAGSRTKGDRSLCMCEPR